MRPPTLLAFQLGGCGTATDVRVSSVGGAPNESIAVLLVPAHHDHLIGSSDQSLHLRAIKIDGVSYALPSEDTRFELPAGKHEVFGEFEDCVHGPRSWFTTRTPQHVNSAPAPDFIGERTETYTLVCRSSWNSGPWVALSFERKP